MSKRFFGIWPWTLTYDRDVESQPSQSEGLPHAKNDRRRSNASGVRVSTDGRMDRRTDATKYIISLLKLRCW